MKQNIKIASNLLQCYTFNINYPMEFKEDIYYVKFKTPVVSDGNHNQREHEPVRIHLMPSSNVISWWES